MSKSYNTMKNEIELHQTAVELMVADGYSVHGALWARSINSPLWAKYVTMASNMEAALCV